MEASPTPRPRFWIALQPSIVKIYKVAGLVALTAILVGLIGFLVVNIFYFFDNSWVRPVVLSPTHQKVVHASTELADAKLRSSQIDTERLEIEAQISEVDRSVAIDEKFIADVGTLVDKPTSADQWMVHRELEKAKLARENAMGRRAPLHQRLANLKLRKLEQDGLVKRLEGSPYLRAVNNRTVLAFVPYQNLRNVKDGTKLYGCSWGLVACRSVGKVTTMLEGEVQDIHPHDESIQRGVMVEIDVSTAAAGETVLFAGGKPLWLF